VPTRASQQTKQPLRLDGETTVQKEMWEAGTHQANFFFAAQMRGNARVGSCPCAGSLAIVSIRADLAINFDPREQHALEKVIGEPRHHEPFRSTSSGPRHCPRDRACTYVVGARTAEIYRRNRSFFAALPQMGDSDF
jgi:hypothetical protein